MVSVEPTILSETQQITAVVQSTQIYSTLSMESAPLQTHNTLHSFNIILYQQLSIKLWWNSLYAFRTVLSMESTQLHKLTIVEMNTLVPSV